jgi:phosphoglycolate phosphatase-like HAD superfamily hydrolase
MKEEAIHQLLKQYNINAGSSAMIGDSITDYLAAVKNKVPFILRKTNLNQSLQNRLKCPMINDFLGLNKGTI